ncbi:purine-binding chemotaxis protein CheW [Azospirillum sp. RWY-5-1]|uniref:Purine-binding chemotaxis protein CheW n=1 Tax=Azospirillum oleiclasticum TaxID=2735135 RepID=A0ABX2TD14_9PROT|nr:chemotaxis protein CheW [Azospirillum oleiclasticum]NYZ14782.1 purine-binding chemotaxis protein CheW [Azospirillum oleiclasticum]NYZ22232.1 purine-binding chemotaxis protein CheW [Azospirillum oleiclasticum]
MHSSTALSNIGSTGGSTGGAAIGAANAHEDQYVTFTVGTEEYGVNILAVREIRGWTPESRLPNLPDYVRGVINLRGIIIPIFDLRARFGGGATEVTKRHVVVVIQVGERTRGILVDAISDILAISQDAIRPPPDLDTGLVDTEYLSGLYTVDNRMVTLLDVQRLFAVEASEEDATQKALPAPDRLS